MDNKISATLVLTALALSVNAQNLIRNPGFENAPEGIYGQGVLPYDWFIYSFSPDTYSNDGSFGLWPHEFGNFPGVTAHGGKRWVAGADDGIISEDFYQSLGAPLTQGQLYEISGWLHQAFRTDLDHPGGYDIAFGTGSNVAHLGDTVSTAAGWTYYSATFVAIGGETNVFFHSSTQGSASYSGLDDVSLMAVPEPGGIMLLALPLLLLRRRRR